MKPVTRRVLAVAAVVVAVVLAVALRPLPEATASAHHHGSAGPDPVTGVVLLANVVAIVFMTLRSRRHRAGAARREKTWTYRG